MPLYYADSSALTKAYARELGTEWMQRLIAEERIIMSALALAEVASALGRRVREGHLDSGRAVRAFQLFVEDASSFDVVQVSESLIRRAASLILGGRIPLLRGSDAVQLATAIQSSILLRQSAEDPLVFVVADKRLRDAATAAGLPVENPEDHA